MKSQKYFLPLKWIVQSFYLICIVFPYSEVESKLRKNISKIVDIVVVLFLVYIVCSDLFLAFYTEDAPFGFIIAALSGDLCSLSIRLVLIDKKKAIATTLRHVLTLHRKMGKEGKIKWHGTSLMVAFAVSWIIPLLLFTRSAAFALTDIGSKKTQMNILFGLYFQTNWGLLCVFLINIFLNQQLYAMPGYAAGLCYYTYKILTATIQNVGMKLQRKADLDSLHAAYIDLTSRVIECMVKVEHALSLLLFLLYTYIISFIFIIVTLLIRSPPQSFGGYELINPIIFFIAFVAFFALSFQSVNVHKASVRVRRTIHRLCSEVPCPTHEDDDAVRFLLLTASETFPLKVVITGWNLFDLNQDFILQTTGAIVSYGTIVSQLGT